MEALIHRVPLQLDIGSLVGLLLSFLIAFLAYRKRWNEEKARAVIAAIESSRVQLFFSFLADLEAQNRVLITQCRSVRTMSELDSVMREMNGVSYTLESVPNRMAAVSKEVRGSGRDSTIQAINEFKENFAALVRKLRTAGEGKKDYTDVPPNKQEELMADGEKLLVSARKALEALRLEISALILG